MTALTSAFNKVTNSSNVTAGGAFSTEFAAAPNQFNLTSDIFGASNVGTAKYYNYNGSLTTPGCNQGISWFVMATPMTASPAQILSFTNALAIEQGGFSRGGDNRLVQPLNGRTILASFAGPATTTVTFAHTLNGLTVATFTPTLQLNYRNSIATALSVQLSSVSIVVNDATTRRHLLGAAVQVVTSVTVPVTTASTVTSMMAANSANPTFMATLASAAGATSATYTPPSALPAPTSAAPSAASAVFAAVAAVAVALAF